MLKTAHSALAAIFCEHIRSLRSRANMSQRELALALGREHGMVARIELGERRVDFAEAFHIFVALGVNPNQEADNLMTKFANSATNESWFEGNFNIPHSGTESIAHTRLRRHRL
jgi:transcriptional regulator with XRE-family HTH domain